MKFLTVTGKQNSSTSERIKKLCAYQKDKHLGLAAGKPPARVFMETAADDPNNIPPMVWVDTESEKHERNIFGK